MTVSPALRPSLRLLRIVWPFVAIVALLLVQAGTSLAVMSAIRAFVASESVWSKAEKAAVQHLFRYAQTRDEADFLAWRVSIAVIASDREARLALDLPRPDYRAAHAALVAAGTDAADVPGMMRLYRYGRRLPFMHRAIGLWSAADSLMVELEEVAGAVHEAVLRGERPGELAPLLLRVREIDAEVTPLGEGFSATLSNASRQTERALTSANAAVALALVLLAAFRTRRLLRDSERFERALLQSEARFERAVAGSSDGIWDWDVARGALFLSPRVHELLNFEARALAGAPRVFLRRVHRGDRDALLASVRNHLRHRAPLDLDLRLRTASGEPRWFRLRGRLVHDADGALRVAGSLTDIGDHKRAEAALWQARDRAEVTLASIADAVITVDLNARVEYLNPVAERLTGWSTEAARGRPIADVFIAVNETSGAAQPDAVPAVLRDGRTVEAEGKLALLPREGAPVAIDRSIAPIRERSGRIVGAVIVFHDMRRERQYAARLRTSPATTRSPASSTGASSSSACSMRSPRRATATRSTPCSTSTSTSSRW